MTLIVDRPSAQPEWAPPGHLEEDGVFVRRSPVGASGAARTVYVHGLGGSSLNWADLMRLRGATSPGVALDLPGFGFSAPLPQMTLHAHADAVIRVIDRDGGDPVDLVGNSMGGAVSVLVAARRPDLVRSLILIAPALPGMRVRLTHAPILLAGVPGVSERLRRRLEAVSPEDRVDELSRLIFFRPDSLDAKRRQDAIVETARRNSLSYSWDAFAQSAQSLSSVLLSRRGTALWAYLRGVKAPVLGIFGAEDRLVDVGVAPKAARRIGRGQVVVLPAIGHVPMMEDPEQVFDVMCAFERQYLR